MELTYATIIVLASMVFVLSGMIGYLYWQQTRTMQHLQSLALALAAHIENTRVEEEPKPSEESQPEEEEQEEDEDDRVSVKEKVEVVEGPPAKAPAQDDVDDLQEKTAAQLRELLTSKGIPFGKRDSKNVLIQLLKATA